ncbi:sensor histidine kinase [Limimaricola variabilis]|nr:histidine kinase dimerization/phosphoacceptor domain -containing protein [Limimaricola variabilis]
MLDAPSLSGRSILHAIPVPAIIMSTNLEIIDVNAAFESAVARQRATLLDRPLFDEFPPRPETPNLEATIRASVARAVDTRQTDALEPGRHDIVMSDGGFETRYWRLSHSPVIEGGEVTCVLQLVEDVTAEVTRQLLLDARERTAEEGAALAFWDLNLVTGKLVRSGGVDSMHGFAPGEVGEDIEPFIERVHPEDRDRVRMEVFSAAEQGPGPTNLEHRLLLPDGTIRWISARGEILPGPVNGEPHLVGMVVDITEFRQNEERLKTALANQKILLDEVNHRVKNSLQMVASLLSLESGRASPETRERLMSASIRVNAIATIHASLYLDGDVTSVAVDQQLRDLCDHVAASSGCDVRGITIDLDLAPIRLCPNQAISLSIIVNELITNALKHAFPGRAEGKVQVRLTRDGSADELVLTVTDDGTGPSEAAGEQAGRSSGLGQRLIHMSARQIGGRIEQSRSPEGWRTTLRFPVPG